MINTTHSIHGIGASGRNVALDNLCVIENELQAAMTNPLLQAAQKAVGDKKPEAK